MKTPFHQKKQICIVEDDKNSADFLISLLENEGYACTPFFSGEKALNALEKGFKADLILLDIMMEGINGYEVCKILKSDIKLKFIPIIIISGKSSVEEKVLGLKLGADDYLVKPFKNKELLAKIQVLLRIKSLQDQLIHIEKLAGIGQLAAGIAHEFNNLIGGMLGYAQLGLMNLEDKGMIEKSFSIIEKSCFRAKELTENMLLFSSNQIRLDTTSILEDCVDQCLALTANQLKKHNVEVLTEFNHSARVKIETSRLLQVFINLIQNSIQILDKTPLEIPRKITIQTSQDKENVVIKFSDNGSGIEENLHDRIFEPFFTTKGALGGGDSTSVGIGLSVVYGIIISYNGSIQLLSSTEKGTVFEIRLQSDVHEEKTNEQENDNQPLTMTDEKIDATVLVVDDEVIYRDLLSDLLEKNGMEVIKVTSGEDAIKTSAEKNFDIIFMDYLMPGMGGIEAANVIQQEHNQGEIVFITGRTIINNLQESLGEKGRHMLAKPFDLKELLALIKQIIPGNA